jgi:hypothetical protein
MLTMNYNVLVRVMAMTGLLHLLAAGELICTYACSSLNN